MSARTPPARPLPDGLVVLDASTGVAPDAVQAGLAILGHAMHADLPVLTGDRHWTTLIPHGLAVDVHLFRDAPAAP